VQSAIFRYRRIVAKVPPDRERCVELTTTGRRCELPRAPERGDGTRCNVHYHQAKKRANLRKTP
jgi:hypothetical protein